MHRRRGYVFMQWADRETARRKIPRLRAMLGAMRVAGEERSGSEDPVVVQGDREHSGVFCDVDAKLVGFNTEYDFTFF